MKTFTRTFIALAISLLTIHSYAQQPPQGKEGKERIRTLKIAFITEQLDLTSKEAQVFWPVYNEADEKMEEIRMGERKLMRSVRENFETLSDSEAAQTIKKMREFRAQRTAAENSLVDNLNGVIPAKKILLLLKAEEEFKARLLRQFRKRHQGQGRRN